MTDIDGVVVKANEAARTLLSLPRPPVTLATELATTYGIRDATDDRRLSILELPMLRALRGERVEAHLYRVDDPKLGRERLVRVTSMPLFGTDGAVRGSVTTFTDA